MATAAGGGGGGGGGDALQFVELDPSHHLRFGLVEGKDARTELRIRNVTEQTVAFKVKTTAPKRYYVRPNQAVISAGSMARVQVVMVRKAAEDFLGGGGEDGAAAQQPVLNADECDDKFLVEVVKVPPEVASRIQDMDSDSVTTEVGNLLRAPPREARRRHKLVVQLLFPERLGDMGAPSAVSAAPSSGGGGNGSDGGDVAGTAAEQYDSRVQDVRAQFSAGGGGRPEMEPLGPASGESANEEQLLGELNSLRKRYDAVVEYTVNLTADRDRLQKEKEELDNDLKRERSRRSHHGSDSESPRASGGASASALDRQGAGKAAGFKLIHVLIIAVAFFLLGRFLQF